MYATDPYAYARQRGLYYDPTTQQFYRRPPPSDNLDEDDDDDDDDDEDDDEEESSDETDSSPYSYGRSPHQNYSSSESSPRSYGSRASYYSQSPPSHYRHHNHRHAIPYRQSSSQQPNQQQQQDRKNPVQPSSASTTTNEIRYYCLFYSCAANNIGFTRKADLERHVETTHNHNIIELFDCEVQGCHRRGNQGFSRRDKMIEHMREVHGMDIPKRQSGARRRSDGGRRRVR